MYNKNSRKSKSQHQSFHSQNLSQQIKGLEQEIELTIYNYENILQAEKKNSSERADFLLYLIQSLRLRQNQQIDSLTMQLHNAEGQRQQAQNMEKQMHNIGQGLDQIVEQSRRLKSLNQSLQKQLEEQEQRDKQLDQQILICQKQVDDCRLKVDDWERSKIKWNRHKKQILQLIEDAEQIAKEEGKELQDSELQKNAIEQLYNKYHNFDA